MKLGQTDHRCGKDTQDLKGGRYWLDVIKQLVARMPLLSGQPSSNSRGRRDWPLQSKASHMAR